MVLKVYCLCAMCVVYLIVIGNGILGFIVCLLCVCVSVCDCYW